MGRGGAFEHSSLAVVAVVSVGLGVVAAVVASLVDRLIAEDDVSLSWAITYGLFMAAFFFVVSALSRRRRGSP